MDSDKWLALSAEEKHALSEQRKRVEAELVAAQLALPYAERHARLVALARRLGAKRDARKAENWGKYVGWLDRKVKRRDAKEAAANAVPGCPAPEVF